VAALQPDAERAVIRGLSAFMKATPAQELPAPLRPIRSFAPRALGPHRKALLDALGDAAFGPRIVRWLDDKQHPLSKKDAEILRLAAERPEGWEEQLAGGPAGVKPSRPQPKGAVADAKGLEREKEKVRRARDEVKRVRAEAAQMVQAEKALREKLEAEVASLREALKDEQRRAAAAEKGRTAAETQLARGQRKSRAASEQLEAKMDRLKRELKEARNAAKARDPRPAAEKEGAAARPPRKKDPLPQVPAGPRKPLPSVPGLLDDHPRTLDAWLGADGVQLLVDGYNVTKSKGGFGDLELPAQRLRLVQEINSLARKKKVKATIVFDGSHVPPGSARLAKGPAVVEYSRPDEIADDHLIALLEQLPPYPAVVVTDDRELRSRAAKLGATVAGSKQLLTLIR
jgi:predicted RNA-binding protein with PIN domain